MDLPGEGRVIKRIRVAVEGQTVDGRTLSAAEIKQMGMSYNTSVYAARINCEHVPGFSPEGPFNAYGDVIAVEAVQENGKWCLYNTISALPNLQTINKAGQKIYPSIEFYRDFRGSGLAYQCGLALTDVPASTGTQAIKLNAQPGILHTQPTIFLELDMSQSESQSTTPATEQSLFERFKELLRTPIVMPASASPAPAPVQLTTQPPALPASAPAAQPVPVANPAVMLSQMEDRIVDKLIQRLSQQPVPVAATAPVVEPAVTATVPATAAPAVAMSADQMMLSMFNMMQQQNQTLLSALANQPAGIGAPTVTGAGSGLTDC